MKFKTLLFLFFCPFILNAQSIYAILLAGGGGTRLWPTSRDEFPKQFIDFGNGESLLQQTVSRLLNFKDLEEIVIATSRQYEPLVRSQLEKFTGRAHFSILIEPSRRNTAPAIAYAVKYLTDVKQIAPDAPILVVPADHFIEPEWQWIQSIENTLPTVSQGQIVTFGIHPTKPETGYGYLELGPRFDDYTYQLARFIEKPNLEKANQLIQSEQVYWNSGIFAFSLRTFWEELKRHSPDIFHLCATNFEEMDQNFSKMPDISIDYAVMEKSDRIVASPLQINWSDIGSWDGLYEILEKNEQGNVFQGNVVDLDTKNSLIFSNKRLVTTIGLEDLLVIEMGDAILICKRGESQKIKALLQKMKEAQ